MASRSVRLFKNCQATNSQAYPRASFTPGSSLATSRAEKCPFKALDDCQPSWRCESSSAVGVALDIQQGRSDGRVLNIGGDVVNEWLQHASRLAATEVIKRLRDYYVTFKEPRFGSIQFL
jgi:hypothetical protein